MDKVYQSVPLDEEQQTSEKETLLWRVERRIFPRNIFKDSKIPQSSLWICHGVLLSISLALFALSYCMRYGRLSDESYTRQFSPYCKLLSIVIKYTILFMSNTFLAPAASVVRYETVRYDITPVQKMSEYIGYGPEVDAAWDHITYDVGDQMITREELDRLGLNPGSLKIKDPKTGKEGYRVGIQVFHQLHCLNLLRQDSYKDWYSHHGGDIEVEPEDLRGHLGKSFESLTRIKG